MSYESNFVDDQLRKLIADYLESEGIVADVGFFVGETSNLYHKYESQIYDRKQKSISNSAKVWKKSLLNICSHLPDRFSLLDFGCGTGFAADIFMSIFGRRVEKLVCFDLSSDMVSICREKLSSRYDTKMIFLEGESGLEKLSNQNFDVVLTNAVLHHLLDLHVFLERLDRLLAPGGIYVMGHEPNANFYRNKSLIKITKRFGTYKRFKWRLSLDYVLQKLKIRSGARGLAQLTNNGLRSRGLIERDIPEFMIRKLVDIHVPSGIDRPQPWGLNGFSKEFVLDALQELDLVCFVSYDHIKDSHVKESWIWSLVEQHLSKKYPDDGSDCLMIFRKKN